MIPFHPIYLINLFHRLYPETHDRVSLIFFLVVVIDFAAKRIVFLIDVFSP